MNLIDTALRIATAAHAGQTDRDGNPVILHALTVGLMGRVFKILIIFMSKLSQK